ncbi:uroporphyrinogen decarboxylase [Helicobacter bilis]|uniref:Uroporphyrinogen decarboxylase n=1 Tax=Helicobacter bilis TaxID=37372 RepID=A0A4U8U9Y4_9HELI|nr:uroporphyrinogen decarboxylase [Helicobacter bilis]MCI7410906.1 uroporphyrinogen decarboxylase [Helicobacter bilis]MDD7297261.1 uroporphyrinogen decarboxylase [Helicobacter bilis]MDY4399514.1 uroporphyrinogen decarboxylase [Helicobacter bilis]TLE07501.1 uroporphyrinogen decarboxylase [Helicobacter bilis]TLE08834.1 uroporphyrinogen decarboxylase [Helicobacter bilis]
MIFIDACLRKKTPYTPIWMMRQAGRYLDEYKATRKRAKNFIDLCQRVDLATEVTLQPIDILDVDAAILFSDILVIPYEMGLPLEFKEGFGPQFLQTITDEESLGMLKSNAHTRLSYVYECVDSVRKRLSKDKALIGFSGAPWTLATYMIEGHGSKSYEKSKKMLYQNPKLLHALLQKLTEEIKQYLSMQIKAGANAVMLFDSWANALEKSKYLEFGWFYLQDIANYLKATFPQIPLIAFPRGVGAFLESLHGKFDVLGIDWQIDMKEAKEKAGDRFVLQGNLEPARLYDYSSMKEGVISILEVMRNSGHIFNLGHGMIKDLPRENAISLVKLVRELSSKYA